METFLFLRSYADNLYLLYVRCILLAPEMTAINIINIGTICLHICFNGTATVSLPSLLSVTVLKTCHGYFTQNN